MRLGDMTPADARRMCKKAMTRFEKQDASRIPGRCELADNEEWSPIVYVNTRYSVQISFVITAIGPVSHLWIRRHDGEMSRSWRDLQTIKNEIAGPECTAVEVFPPTSELVDSANMTHLWVYPPDWVMPFRLQPGERL